MKDPIRLTLRNNPFIPSQGLVKRHTAQEVGGCDPRIQWTQDYSLALRLARLGPFVSTSQVVTYIPDNVPGRVSSNRARELQQGTLTCLYFFQDFPELRPPYLGYGTRRAVARAWRYAHRYQGATFLSKTFLSHMVGRMVPLPEWAYLRLLQGCLQVYAQEASQEAFKPPS